MGRVTRAVENGATVRDAATYAGIGERTVHRWRARGEHEEERQAAIRSEGIEPEPDPDDEPYWQFWRAVTRARAAARMRAVVVITSAFGDPDPRVATQNAQWFLERSSPEEWARRQPDVSVQVDSRQIVQVQTVAEQRRRAQRTWDEAVAVGAFDALGVALGESQADRGDD
jgi:hypothetical protein